MMRRFVWFFVGVFLAAGPMLAFAEDYPAIVTYYPSGHPDLEQSDPLVAGGQVCQFVSYGPYTDWRFGVTASKSVPSPWSIGSQQTVQCFKNVNWYAGDSVLKKGGCPGGGTLSNGVCVGAPSCTAPQVRNPVTGVCGAPPCTAGTEHSSGYYDYGLQPESKMTTFGCADGCEVTFSGDAPAGRQLVGGVYHYFARGSYNRTGTACTSGPSVSPSTPALPPAGCGPNQGSATMNGKTVCVDEATGTQTNPYAPKPTPETTENKTTTTNPDGSTTTVTETCTGPNACTTTTQTCTGPNSCTSTTTTTGGGAGGGGGPGPGTSRDKDFNADGTPDFDAEGNPVDPEQDNLDQCQKTPNASMCQEKVKLDPEDSPTEADYSDQNTAHDDAWAEVKANVEGRGWEWTSLGFVWNPQIPSGACSSVTVFGHVIDTCYALEKARALWAWVIGVTAGLAIWIMGTRAVSGAKL